MLDRRPLPDQALLRLLLDYDPISGALSWRERSPAIFTDVAYHTPVCLTKRWNTRYAEKEAFSHHDSVGYLSGKLLGKTYRAHRVIWKWMTGEEPQIVDHINGDRLDNRWGNLRSVNDQANARNSAMLHTNTSGHAGVSFNRASQKWRAYICRQYLGSFGSVEEAIRARKAAEERLGFHPNHGRAV